ARYRLLHPPRQQWIELLADAAALFQPAVLAVIRKVGGGVEVGHHLGGLTCRQHQCRAAESDSPLPKCHGSSPSVLLWVAAPLSQWRLDQRITRVIRIS